ncbi:MAG: TonB-dependent receptor [Bacteroidetes bacterium]|nr:TonB-dependent receptor [Bacteroidota bacterium]
MKVIFTSLLLFAVLLNAHAQNAVLKGKVTDKNNVPIASATVSLLKASDSSWVHTEISGDDGGFTMQNIVTGSYLLDISAAGFEQAKQVVTIKAGDNDIAVTVAAKSKTLNEVTVTGKKSFIESSLGKTIVNVEGSGIATGSNVLDLLRKLPGVTVDGNNNISMAGKQGVLLLINGKETFLSTDQLADYLKGMSADEVARMELITQPSAKYDASGNAGIIDIKLKKMRKAGLNGSTDAEYGQGVYPIGYAALRLNYHKNKLNLFADGTWLDAIGWVKITRNRSFYDPQGGAVTGYDNSVQESKEYFSNDKMQLGADYDLSSKTTIGISATGIYHPNHESTYTAADIADYNAGSLIKNGALTRDTFLRTNEIANAYLKHEFSKEHTLDVNLDFVNYNQQTKEHTSNANEAILGIAPAGLDLDGYMPYNMNAYSVKADYAGTLGKTKLETGLKSSLVAIENKQDYQIPDNGTWIRDTSRSNDFAYHENVNAAYVNGSRELGKKWQVQLGLRAEQVNLEGLQLVGNKSFSNNYISFFPTAYVAYKVNDNNQLELNYGRRIDRPNYKRLNPFITFINQFSYSVGNPELRPEFSNNVELKHSYKNQLITSLSGSYATDMMGTVVVPDANTKGTHRTDVNMGTRKTVNASINYNKEFYKWFLLSVSGDGYYAVYAGKLLGQLLKTEGGGVFITVDTQFVLGKWTAELYYNVNSGYRNDLVGTSKPGQDLSIFISRKLLNDTCTVKLHLRDPLRLNRTKEHAEFDNTVSDTNYQFHTRQVALSLAYAFGKNTGKSKHESEVDELKRMN